MTTTSITHRPSTFIVATSATGLVSALLALTLNSAQAIPERIDSPAVVDRTVDATPHKVERPCFITPPTWNEALDGPLPHCYTYLP